MAGVTDAHAAIRPNRSLGSSATVAGAALLGRLAEHKIWGLAAVAAVLITLTVGAALANNSRLASSAPS
ncbi:hypothetical protein [Rhodococcus sp. USK13]|uniref:hypothetical protein n=1 Tax=Rhodococcus sp. USK13 TaxID=2806442 RepID=UPI001BD167E7|nr:hypothetical protein [Rhodococcus sp. USK13]